MAIPTVKEWTEFVKKYGVDGGAATKAFQAYWNSGANTPKTYLVAYTALETALVAYIGKVSKTKKKIKDYETFEREFMNKYLGQVHKERMDTDRGMATLKTYQAEIAKFMTMVQKLSKTKSTREDLTKFKQGPARGLSAMASQARGLTKEQLVTLNKITQIIKGVDTIVDKMPAQVTQNQIAGYVGQIVDIAHEIATEAKEGGIVANK